MTEITESGNPGGRTILPATIAWQRGDFGWENWQRYLEMDRAFRERADKQAQLDRPDWVDKLGKVRVGEEQVARISSYKIITEKQGVGDVNVASKQIRDGLRVHVYICLDGRAFGFRRIDFVGGRENVEIGALYVDEEQGGKMFKLPGQSGKDVTMEAWKHLVRVPYFLARQAGYSTVTTVLHNSSGGIAMRWQDRQICDWEHELLKMPSRSFDELIQ